MQFFCLLNSLFADGLVRRDDEAGRAVYFKRARDVFDAAVRVYLGRRQQVFVRALHRAVYGVRQQRAFYVPLVPTLTAKLVAFAAYVGDYVAGARSVARFAQPETLRRVDYRRYFAVDLRRAGHIVCEALISTPTLKSGNRPYSMNIK